MQHYTSSLLFGHVEGPDWQLRSCSKSWTIVGDGAAASCAGGRNDYYDVGHH